MRPYSVSKHSNIVSCFHLDIYIDNSAGETNNYGTCCERYLAEIVGGM